MTVLFAGPEYLHHDGFDMWFRAADDEPVQQAMWRDIEPELMKLPSECQHVSLYGHTHLSVATVPHRMIHNVEVTVRCTDCGSPMIFTGVPIVKDEADVKDFWERVYPMTPCATEGGAKLRLTLTDSVRATYSAMRPGVTR